MAGEQSTMDAIVALMRDNWDTPADCNDGELFAYAEHLRARIVAGDDPASLEDYLRAIQTGKLDMPDSDAYRAIVNGALAASVAERDAINAVEAASNEGTASADKGAAITDEDALPEMAKSGDDAYDGSPI